MAAAAATLVAGCVTTVDKDVVCDVEPQACGGSANATQETAMEVNPSDGPGTTANGSLTSSGGIDWYTYVAVAGTFSSVEPQLSITSDGPVEACMYTYCAITCPANATAATAPGGQNGCCVHSDAGGGEVGFQVDGCATDGFNEVWYSVEVDEPTCNACVGYTLGYNT